jgi:DNA polymerase III subunit delta
MSTTVAVLDYLAPAKPPKPPAVCVLFGDEPFLKQLALKRLIESAVGSDRDAPYATFDCEERLPEWRDVMDELSTQSLFGGGGPKLVVLRTADKFVSTHRPRLEDHVSAPRGGGSLVLEVDEWPANTRLYKAVDQTGLQIDCRPPQRQQGKTKVPDEPAMVAWISSWASEKHGFVLGRDAAQLLLDLTGPVFALLDQNLAKLALFAGSDKKINALTVQEVVGGWRAKSTWDLVDAAVNGDAAEALQVLDRLLQSGEHPLALFGSIAWSLRRYAAATRLFQQAERRGDRPNLREALLAAGFRDWPVGTLKKAEDRLKQLGRDRASRLYRWLVEADLAMKGTHSQDERARFVLEQLIFRMSKQAAAPARPAKSP